MSGTIWVFLRDHDFVVIHDDWVFRTSSAPMTLVTSLGKNMVLDGFRMFSRFQKTIKNNKQRTLKKMGPQETTQKKNWQGLRRNVQFCGHAGGIHVWTNTRINS